MMNEKKTITLPPDHPRERLDKALAEQDLGLTRVRIQALIKDSQVLVNGKPAITPSQKVSAGDRLIITIPPPEPLEVEAEDIPLKILFEDEHVLVLNKPAGLVVHPAPGNYQGTLVNALLHHCGKDLSGIGGVQRPGIVHRLDKDTSGVMIVAKSDKASQSLTTQFAEHSIERQYRAVVWGRPTPLLGSIDAPIGRHPSNRIKMAVVGPTQGKRARTHYKVEQSFGPLEKPIASLVTCRLETGRTHQVRVHMAHIGHPLIGDTVYGARRKLSLDDGTVFPRQALHAAVLGFEHPVTGERLTFESPLPNDMHQLVKRLEKD